MALICILLQLSHSPIVVLQMAFMRVLGLKPFTFALVFVVRPMSLRQQVWTCPREILLEIVNHVSQSQYQGYCTSFSSGVLSREELADAIRSRI